jgi:hypothetical protein
LCISTFRFFEEGSVGIRKKLAFQALTYAAAMGASALASRGANQGWKMVRREHPPLNPASRKTSWKAALTFAAITGAVGAVAGVASRRAVAGAWRAKVGRLPMGER